MALFGLLHRAKDGTETPIDVENVIDDAAPQTASAPPADGELARLRAELAAKDEAIAAESRKAKDLQSRLDAKAADAARARVDGIHAASAAFADGLSAKITPACAGPLARVHAALALAAAGLPTVDAAGAPIDARADLESLFAALPGHGLGAGSIAASEAKGLKPMGNGAAGADPDARAKAANDAFFAQMGATRDPAPTY